MQTEDTKQNARDKEKVETLAEGTGKLVNQRLTRTFLKETSERYSAHKSSCNCIALGQNL